MDVTPQVEHVVLPPADRGHAQRRAIPAEPKVSAGHDLVTRAGLQPGFGTGRLHRLGIEETDGERRHRHCRVLAQEHHLVGFIVATVLFGDGRVGDPGRGLDDELPLGRPLFHRFVVSVERAPGRGQQELVSQGLVLHRRAHRIEHVLGRIRRALIVVPARELVERRADAQEPDTGPERRGHHAERQRPVEQRYEVSPPVGRIAVRDPKCVQQRRNRVEPIVCLAGTDREERPDADLTRRDPVVLVQELVDGHATDRGRFRASATDAGHERSEPLGVEPLEHPFPPIGHGRPAALYQRPILPHERVEQIDLASLPL